MKTDNYLSKLQLVISIIFSTVVFAIIPFLLSNNASNEIIIYTLRNYFSDKMYALPAITKYAISFTDYKTVRFLALMSLLIIGISLEIFIENKKITGTFHSVILILSVVLGIFYLLACLMPFIPL